MTPLINCITKMRIIILLTVCFLLMQTNSFSQNIGINNPTPDASSLLDLTSTSQGLLVPRMTTAQRNAITAPANGLLVYDTSLLQFYYYDGTQWQPIFTASNGWGLSGNAGTNPATNFLGTTDNQPLNFRMNNQKVGMISSTDVFFGYQAGNSDNGTHNSTGIGIGALSSNTSGTGNTAIGAASLFLNTGGAGNTAIGSSALVFNTTGNGNIGVGHFAGQENTIGSDNIAIGVNALAYNVAGSNAVAIGRNAMINANNQASAFTNSNVAVGYEALRGSFPPSANTGNNNTALGYQTLWSNSTGSLNIANGYQALYSNNTGSNNTAIGFNTLNSNVAGSNATAIGANAMQYANNQASAFTNSNVAIGYEALRGSGTPSANTGNWNTALGYQTLWSNSSGSANTVNGYQALYSNTTGFNNTANGYHSLYSNTTGTDNTACGLSSLYSNTTGVANTAFGDGALLANSTGIGNTANGASALISNTGSANTAIGLQSLYSNTTGNNNTAAGYFAGNANTTGGNNTFLGYGADLGSPTQRTNATAIGYNARVDASNALVLGGTGADAVSVGIGTTNPSLARLQVQGMVGNTVGYFNGGIGSRGLSLISDSPGLYFNSYLNGGTKSMGNSGFPAIINTDQGSGGIMFQTSNVAITSADANVSVPERMRITGTGDVGIGTTNPSFARLQVQGMVGNTVAYFNGGVGSKGISMVSDWPGIYLNSYYNGAIKSMGNTGFPAVINTDQGSGGIVFQATNVAITSANANISIPERMRITGTGNVGIGTNNPLTALHLGNGGVLRLDGNPSGNRSGRMFVSPGGNLFIDAYGGGATYINWNSGPGLFIGNGGGSFGPAFAAAFIVSSSVRFKKDIVNTRYGLAEILKLQAREYKYIDDKTGRNEVGLIAEDVEKIIPEVVYRSAEDNQVMGIDYGKLSPVLIEAIKEQQKMIDGLKTEMAALKSELNEARNK